MAVATYASFLVRLWRESILEQPEAVATWQGEVEHIQTNQRWAFDSLDELLELLCWRIEDPEQYWQCFEDHQLQELVEWVEAHSAVGDDIRRVAPSKVGVEIM